MLSDGKKVSTQFISKYRINKFWNTLFIPNCFGVVSQARHCVNLYFDKSTSEKAVYPCRHYNKCIQLAQINLDRRIHNASHSKP